MNVISYVGIPYEAGVWDCWCLVKKFAKEQLNINYPDYFYDVSKLTEMADKLITDNMKTIELSGWKQVSKPEIGNLLIFIIAGKPTHCGIYIGDGLFLHTLLGHNSTVESLDIWHKRLVGAYQWQA